MNEQERLLQLLLHLQRSIRDSVVSACAQCARSAGTNSAWSVASDGPGDTIYAIDKVGEELLIRELDIRAGDFGGIRLVAEGIDDGYVDLPLRSKTTPRWRMIVDPIDGTRGIMYQKRSAWVLSAVAPEKGDETRLSDVVVAAQTEIPTEKQRLSDELWAIRGQGAELERYNAVSGSRQRLVLRPSQAASIEHGYAMISRFFPGAREELAAIDEEIIFAVLGPSPPGKARCFEDQYASTGGQLYELSVGHDRFNADLRPLMQGHLRQRQQPLGLCCHPYDLCTALIAREAGVILTDPEGRELDAPLNVEADVAWVGYANTAIRECVEPALLAALKRRDLIGAGGGS